MKFSGKVGKWPVNKRLNFGGDPDHRLDTEIVFFGFVTVERYGKCIQSFIYTDSPDGGADIATLVRRALAKVCTALSQCF